MDVILSLNFIYDIKFLHADKNNCSLKFHDIKQSISDNLLHFQFILFLNLKKKIQKIKIPPIQKNDYPIKDDTKSIDIAQIHEHNYFSKSSTRKMC